jgi:hypothetical protein
VSGNNLPIDSKCLEILDAALRHSITLTQSYPAEELLAKMQSGPKDLLRLTDALRDPPPAAMWLQDSFLARHLPIVLRLQDASSDDPGRSGSLQRLLFGEIDCRRWRWTRWVYPSIILVAAILVAILLGTTIVPTFKEMFLDFDLRLPAPTRWLIWMSDCMILHPVWSIGAVIALLGLFALTRIGMLWIEDRIPSDSILSFLLSGSRRQLRGMARWTGSLAEMLRLGIPIPQAIRLAGMLSGQRSLEMQSMRLAQESANGREIGVSSRSNVRRTWSISPVAMAALQYPDSDKRIALLRTLSDLYWNRLAVPSRASAGWIAPLAVVLVGTIVAFVAIALFMPLISLVTSLSS